MTLYEIINAIDEVTSDFQIDEETGEIIMDFDRIEALNLAKEEKVENVGKYILNLEAEAKALLERKKEIERRIKSLTSRAEHTREYLKNCLNGEPFKCVDFEIKFTKSERVEINEDFFDNSFNDKYFKRRFPEADKVEIKKALKQGVLIPGASLVECQNMNLK